MATWWQLAAGLLGGGAMGALLTAVITAFRGRIQPVSYTVRVTLLSPTKPGISLIFCDDSGTEWPYSNLYETVVSVRNQSNKDWPRFSFGLTLQSYHKATFASVETPDRHHELALASAISPSAPISELDYTSTPFNRGDEYTLKLYIVAYNNRPLAESDIRLGSVEAVRFSRVSHL